MKRQKGLAKGYPRISSKARSALEYPLKFSALGIALIIALGIPIGIHIQTGIQSSPAWLSTVFYCFEETTNKYRNSYRNSSRNSYRNSSRNSYRDSYRNTATHFQVPKIFLMEKLSLYFVITYYIAACV